MSNVLAASAWVVACGSTPASFGSEAGGLGLVWRTHEPGEWTRMEGALAPGDSAIRADEDILSCSWNWSLASVVDL